MSSISGLGAAAAACGREIENDFVGCLINDKDQIKVSDQPQKKNQCLCQLLNLNYFID